MGQNRATYRAGIGLLLAGDTNRTIKYWGRGGLVGGAGGKWFLVKYE
jgi:hypothetical protein